MPGSAAHGTQAGTYDYESTSQYADWVAARERRSAQRWGAGLLTIGLVLLAGVIAIGAWGISDYENSVSITARIVEIDDGWCTYDWEGLPRPLGGSDYDSCPSGAEVGGSVGIFVNPDGTAWSSSSNYVSYVVSEGLFGLTVPSCLIAPGLWLLLRGGANGASGRAADRARAVGVR
ncbi:MAG: hypothetical protein WCF04_13820 [Candidatus Nanopelagicales bacterium]